MKKTSVKEAHVYIYIDACIVGEKYSGVKLNTSSVEREREEKKRFDRDFICKITAGLSFETQTSDWL